VYLGSTPAKWLFPQEKATFPALNKGSFTLVLLYLIPAAMAFVRDPLGSSSLSAHT